MTDSISGIFDGPHAHPSVPCWVEVVAYQRKDKRWDVFLFEPKGSIPELEEKRVDEDHIFFKTIESIENLNSIIEEIHLVIGPGYEPRTYFREDNSRKWVGRIYDHLRDQGRTGTSVHEFEPGKWEILVRKKDFPKAAEVIETNFRQ